MGLLSLQPVLGRHGNLWTWRMHAHATQSGSFIYTAASFMPIRIVTKEIRYIHELSLALEHSMSISSPAVPGLTGRKEETIGLCPLS